MLQISNIKTERALPSILIDSVINEFAVSQTESALTLPDYKTCLHEFVYEAYFWQSEAKFEALMFRQDVIMGFGEHGWASIIT